MLSSKLQLTLRDRKVLAAICALVLVCSGLSAFVMHQIDVKAQSSALTMQTNSGGPYPGSPTYTIWTENGNYYSKNAYGAITSSVSATTIIQNTITNAPNR